MKVTKFNDYNFITEMMPVKLSLWQKNYIKFLCGRNETRIIFIEGDAWKLKLSPSNIRNSASFNLKDYDENKNIEAEINIDFTKKELDMFIEALKEIRQNMKGE